VTDSRFEATTTTTCGYCGVGCRLEAHRADGRVASISPAMDGPANKGHTCVKGRFAHQFTRSRDRLTAPLVREGGGFRIASWEEAIARVADGLGRVKAEHGPDAIAGLASSRGTNEDCYAMQRLMRAAIGTHNIDNCSRVCHSPTSFALRKSFGLSGATGSFDDIEAAEVALLVGVNPTQGHPVVGARIKQAAIKGLKLITADPRRIELADYGQIHLGIRPGTNAALLNGLAHVVVRDGLVDRGFVESRTEGVEALEEMLTAYTPEAVEEITGVPAADIVAAAHMYAEADRACILWGLGVTEHRYGSEVVRLICNLALLTGNVGRPGAALLPLRGQNNVQGSSDMGALPDTLTDYRPVTDDAVTSAFEQRWGVEMKRERGMKIPEMFDAAVEGRLKAMYIFGEDVAQTDPNTEHVVHALESLDFLVCQDIFENETTKYADVILPASSFLEKSGTFTNAERRVQLVEPAAEPPGAARTDFEIILEVSRALGYDMGWKSPADAMDEVADLTPRYAGLRHELIGRGGLQWPVAADGTDSPILYDDHFDLPGGKAQFAPLPYKPPGDQADADFPLILVTGRRLEHYNAGTMTRRTGNLDLMPADWLEVHPDDAAAHGIADGQTVTVRSRRGQIELPVQVTERIEPGHVFTAFHFPEVRTNLLIGPSADVNTSCPEYKVVAVAVEPVGDAPEPTPAAEPALQAG
jgi:formate dehydrogenase major subunit